MTRPQATWYFDFISPFAWLQSQRLDRFQALADVELKPVVFGGLLGHWGHRGPAEIPAKRRFSYRHLVWIAERAGIPTRFPPAHPFNPLRALRLAVALECRREAVDAIFRFIWQEGRDPNQEWDALCARLGVADGDARIARPEVKERLRANGEEALAAGVFGVPTLAVDGELYWGFDATDMAVEALQDPARFRSGEYGRVGTLPAAVERRMP